MRQLSKLLLTFLILVSANPVLADTTTHGFTIPDAHPRLWWTTARLATALTWYNAHPFNATGDYWVFKTAWKHIVTGSSCSTAIDWMRTYTIADNQLDPLYSGVDKVKDGAETVAVVYDWCYDQLTTQQKSDVFHNLNSTGKGWDDYITAVDLQSWGRPAQVTGNFSAGYRRADIVLSIAGYTEDTTFAETKLDYGLITRWTDNFVAQALLPSSKLPGGAPPESGDYSISLGYWPIIGFESIELMGRNIFSESDYFKQFIYNVIYGTTPSATWHKDSGNTYFMAQPTGEMSTAPDYGGVIHARTYLQDLMNFYSNAYSSLNVGKDARQWWNVVSADAGTMATSEFILAQDASSSARATSNLPLDYYATGMQFLYARKAWDTSSATAFFQMLAGEDHSDNYIGNFHVWRGGRWLTIESTGYSNSIYGYGSFATASTFSLLAHNTIVFSTPLYDDAYVARLPSIPLGNAVVNRLESTSGYAYADVDMTNLYKWDAGHNSDNRGAVVHVEREFLFLRDLETTVVFDRITTGNVTKVGTVDYGITAANEVNTFILHSEVDPTIYDNNHFDNVAGTQSLYTTLLLPASPDAVRSIDEKNDCAVPANCDAGSALFRIEIDTHGAAQRYFLTVLQARATTTPLLVSSVVDSNPASTTSGTFTVTIHPATGADTTIVFNKGQTSSGGSVNLAGAGVTNLRSNVQGITYTDNGPVWEGTSGSGSSVVSVLHGTWKGGTIK